MGCPISLAGKRPSSLGLRGEGAAARLAPCPSSPNCVCSDAADAAHHIEPFELCVEPQSGWRSLRAELEAAPRTEITEARDDYLHAEARTRLLGFVDDLEFHLRPGAGTIAVRSASRLGYSDLGVNRARLEALRIRLRSQGVVR